MWSIECTPTAVIAPPGASSGCARQLSAGDELAGAGGVLADHRHDLADPAVGEALADFDDRGVEAAIEADRQHHAGLLRGLDGGFGARPVEGQRLLHMDVLARAAAAITCSACRLCGVASTTASIRVGENVLEAASSGMPLLAAELLGARARAGVRRDESIASVLPCTALTSERPQRPSPMMAARTVMTLSE